MINSKYIRFRISGKFITAPSRVSDFNSLIAAPSSIVLTFTNLVPLQRTLFSTSIDLDHSKEIDSLLSEDKDVTDVLEKTNVDSQNINSPVFENSLVKSIKMNGLNSTSAIDLSRSDDSYDDSYFDTILSPDVRGSLSIITSSNDLQDFADSQFKAFCQHNSISTFPDGELSHLKSRSEVETIKSLQCVPQIMFETWKDVIKAHIDASKCCETSLEPIPDYMIDDLNRALSSSKSLSNDYIFHMMTSSNNTISNIVYGSAHGLHDLSYFIESEFVGVDFEYNYDSKVSEDSKNNVIIQMTKDNEKSGEWRHTSKLAYLAFPESNIDIPKRYADYSKSIFSRESFKGVLQDILDVTTRDISIKFKQTATSSREAVILKSSDSVSYADAFRMTAVVNDSVKLDLYDRVVVDCLMGLIHHYPLIREDEKAMSEVLAYIATVIHYYVKSQPIITQGLSIVTLQIKIQLNRRVNDDKQLSSIYSNHVESGLIIPLSPLQYQLYFRKSISPNWRRFMGITTLSSPYCSDSLAVIMPSMTSASKSNLSNIIRNKDMRSSYWYVSKVSLPFSKDMSLNISVRHLLLELYVRIMMSDTIDSVVPLFSRAGWPLINGRTPMISIPRLSKVFCKFGLAHSQIVIKNVVHTLSFRDVETGTVKTSPKYIKGTSRSTERIPKMFNMFVDSDTYNHALNADRSSSVYDSLE